MKQSQDIRRGALSCAVRIVNPNRKKKDSFLATAWPKKNCGLCLP